MASVRLGAALRQIHGLFEDGTVAGLTDGQLLDRYLTRRDESAFAALVMRHGPMVLGVCHAVLHGSPEVEDAFQATFLVLIRKAATIRGRDAVGGWLHRVAHRVAVEAGRDRARRDRRERATGDPPDRVAVGESLADDDWRIPLHEELARLPERFRQPVVLCYLEGKTHAQAAVELKWSEATLRRRLADARGLLRSRLTRRGVAVSSGALAAALSSQATAAVPSGWADALARVAAGPTSGACGLGRRDSTRRHGGPESVRRAGADRRERRDRAARDRPGRRSPGPGGTGQGRRSRPDHGPPFTPHRAPIPPGGEAQGGRDTHGPRPCHRSRRQAARRGQGLRLSTRPPAGRRRRVRPWSAGARRDQ